MSGGCAAVFRMKHSHGLVTEVKFLILLLRLGGLKRGSRQGNVPEGGPRARSWGKDSSSAVLCEEVGNPANSDRSRGGRRPALGGK